mmetsp:Transcript_17252/g.42801  ORF Transcript_17252/g.42801 Transcript_17252/m.42801 type:complete len:774 (+) Transcript_17252:57-2378(+)
MHVLAFDLSTQSCKAIVAEVTTSAVDGGGTTTTTSSTSSSTSSTPSLPLAERCRVVFETCVNFEADLPHYGTTSGFKICEGGTITSPVLMWVEAFELCLSRIPKELRERVDRISGAAQQHGTVYLTEQAVAVALARSSGSSSSYFWPVEELLYRSDAPIWMDMSTTAQVNRLEESFGWRELTHRTGSRAYERFSGVQIAKVLEEEEGKAKKPGEKLARVQLVSNFMCSLCAGCLCPIELSDAAGMNLLNLHTNAWDTDILRFLNIEQTLLGGPPDVFVSSSASSSTTTSCPDKNISPYLVEQYGFRENAVVLPWTGDNCSAVVGSGLFSDGEAVVSLGTSDTLLFLLPEGEGGVLSGGDEDNVLAQQLPYGHTFPHAAMDGRKFMMLCYSNGDVCRKAVRDSCVREECAAEFAEFASAGSSSTSTRTPAAIRPPGVRVEVDGDPTTAAGADHVEASAATPQTSAELSPPNEVEDQLSGNAETRLPIRKHSTGSKPQLSLTELSVNSRSPSIGHGDEWTEETPAMQAAKLWRRFDSLVAEARKSVGEFVAAFTAVDEICPPVKQVSVEVVPATAKTSSTGTAPTDVKKTAAVPPFRRSVPALFAKRTSSFSYELEPGPVGSDPNITPAVFCRAVLEHRALAMKAHARKLKGPSSNRDGLFSRITVAGGGARNEGFLQILADVFQCEVVVRENAANLCAMGAVYRCALWGGSEDAKEVPPGCRASTASTPPSLSGPSTKVIRPDASLAETYEGMLAGYEMLEQHLMENYSRRKNT